MPNCIICKKQITKKSIEHIIPDAIGGCLTTDCICSDCNSKLGDKVDYLLTNDEMFLFLRNRFGVKNRDGKPVDLIKSLPFTDTNGNPVIIKKGDGIEMPPMYDGSQPPSVSISESSDGKVSVKLSGSDSQSITKKAMREAKKKNINISKESVENSVKSCRKTWELTLVETDISAHWNKYIPCIAKISFEIGYILFGEQYLSDVRGEEFRHFLDDFINNIHPNNFKSSVQIVYDAQKLSEAHSIQINIENGVAYISITLFGGVQFILPFTYNPGNYKWDGISNINLLTLLARSTTPTS